MTNHPNRRLTSGRGLITAITIIAMLAVSLLAYGRQDARAIAAPAANNNSEQHMTGNWNFERGDLSGWHTRSRGSGAWYAYSDGTTAPNPQQTDPNVAFNVPDPPQGRYAAVTDMNAPGTRILYRDVKLDAPTTLKFTVFYDNAGEFSSPASLEFDGCQANQQFRVELLDPVARSDTTTATDVLATIFKTAPGDPSKLAPKTVTFDLSQWAGQRVRIRFAQVDNRGPLRAGIDDVRLEQHAP
ncbi:MAG: hypothetical protein LC777_07860 [Actinobacteria bacterium]|nr:hypothetical protein [Actinomycetota bacterium]